MSATLPTGFPHITVDDDGVARVAGSRLKVVHLVAARKAWNWTAEDLAAQFPPLTLAQVHAALAFYYDHQAELDDALRQEEHLAEQLRDQLDDGELRAKLAERLAARNQP